MTITKYVFPHIVTDMIEATKKSFAPLLNLFPRKQFMGEKKRSKYEHLPRSISLNQYREFRDHSDWQLQMALKSINCRSGKHLRNCDGNIFGIVVEALIRRLGIWEIFNTKLSHNMANPTNSTNPSTMILKHGIPHTSIPNNSTDANDNSIGRIIDVVQKRIQVEQKGDILLTAEFYHALESTNYAAETAFIPTQEQLLAGSQIYQGHVVEMNAGEGKTFAAVFPAVAHVNHGRKVHIITSNDYLAVRDMEQLQPLYKSLGISAKAIVSHMGDDERRDAYKADIVYCTVRELGFDFLKDNLKYTREEMLQGELDVAIVDEADEVLIDEARTPLIISGGARYNTRSVHKIGESVRAMCEQQSVVISNTISIINSSDDEAPDTPFLYANIMLADPKDPLLTEKLAEDTNLYHRVREIAIDSRFGNSENSNVISNLYYYIDEKQRFVTLTDRGVSYLETRLGMIFDSGELKTWQPIRNKSDRAKLSHRRKATERSHRRISRLNAQINQIHQSLIAHTLLSLDENYMVSEGQIVLIDQTTGRKRPESRYRHSLQTALAIKERISTKPESETLAKISVQGLMHHYKTISGMTGTAISSEDEFLRKYDLKVTSIPPTNISKRSDLPTRLYTYQADKFRAILDQSNLCQKVNRPILIVTPTIVKTEQISELLTKNDIPHRVLNALKSDEEAEIVKSAGQPKAVTVATHMAGRGTDIRLNKALNNSILEGYLNLIGEILESGDDVMVLECARFDEAKSIHDAISNNLEFQSTINCHTGNFEVVVSKKEVNIEGNKRYVDDNNLPRVEFGLGLCIIGAEMTGSDRTDQQLRGRGGRQGQHSSTRFLLSLEDRALALSSGIRNVIPKTKHPPLYEGITIQRELERTQELHVSNEGFAQSVTSKFDLIVEAQAQERYKQRLETMDSIDMMETCTRLIKDQTFDIINRYFLTSNIGSYHRNFDEMSQEIWLDYGINCTSSFGLGTEALSETLINSFIQRFKQVSLNMGISQFNMVAKITFIQTSDELWRDQLVHLDEVSISVISSSSGYDTAVADYYRKAAESYKNYQEGVSHNFLKRVLAISSINQVKNTLGTESRLVEDLEKILV